MYRESELSFEDFLWIPYNSFKSIGYDFLQKPKPRWLHVLLNTYIAVELCCHAFCNFYLCQQFPSVDLRHDMVDIMDVASCIAFSINSNIKYMAFLGNRNRIQNIYAILKQHYPKTPSERRLYRVRAHCLSRLERIAAVFFILCCWILVLAPLVQCCLSFIVDLFTKGWTETHFAYVKFYFFQYYFKHDRPHTYLLAYGIEIMHSHYVIMTSMGTDLWLICFMAQICMHMEHIGHLLEHMEPKVENAAMDCQHLGNIIRKHQMILKIHSELNRTFKLSMAFNLLSMSGVLCTVAVRAVIMGVNLNFLLFCQFLLGTVAQFYMVCYYGQRLAEASENIALAAYKQSWYNGSTSYKKMLLIVMMRATKPAKIDVVAGNSISLDTFKVILSSTYRVFTIFRTMSEQ